MGQYITITCWNYVDVLKEEIHYQNSINSKRERKQFPTEQCNNYENQIRNKEVMTFWNFIFFSENTSWPVLMNIQMSELMMSSPHNCSIHFIYRNDKNLIFQLWEYKTCIITTQSKWEIMFTLIHFDMGICFYLYELKLIFFSSKFHIQYIWKIVRGWHHQLAHFNIHKDWSRNVFRKKYQNVISSLFLIQFSSFFTVL